MGRSMIQGGGNAQMTRGSSALLGTKIPIVYIVPINFDRTHSVKIESDQSRIALREEAKGEEVEERGGGLEFHSI